MDCFTAFLDSNVLYPAALRNFLMWLALNGLFRARWSDMVHKEWMGAVARDFSDVTRAQLERTRDLMNLHAEDSLVTGFEELIESLELPDPSDRHVLAAAIRCGADVLVTGASAIKCCYVAKGIGAAAIPIGMAESANTERVVLRCLLHLLLLFGPYPLRNMLFMAVFAPSEVNGHQIGSNQLRHRDLTAFYQHLMTQAPLERSPK